MARLFRFARRWLEVSTPDALVRGTWIIFALTAPFLVISFWGTRSWVEVLRLFGAMAWAFTFANAYLNRFYWRLFKGQSDDLASMVNTLQVMWHQMHSHCPNCGQQLKEPEVRQ